MSEKERFFGLHFDFHAGNVAKIGSRTNAEDIEWYIKETRPDFVQCDCKGHPGIASYPTEVGTAASNLVKDNLKIWCDTVHKHGLPVFVHYSGVIDNAFVEKHPEEAAKDEKGELTDVCGKTVSLFGNYVDMLMIPQLKELIDEYHIDGVWVDGDCWAVRRDFSEYAQKHLYEGMTEVEHNKIMHDAFLNYVKKYVDEIHKYKPDFKITSNWMYTSYIPEKPTVGIDFISGDYCAFNSVHEARYESRCIAAQNMPWDLMSWSFEVDYKTHWTHKSAPQLCQEAAITLAMGGGFQLYITQNSDGSARQIRSSRFKETADFVHARRINFKKKPVSQIGVFYSEDSYYQKSEIFNAAGATKALIGGINILLDCQYTVGVILQYQIDSIFDYDVVVIPQWEYITEDLKKKFTEYASKGGKLVIVGAEACRQFGELMDKDFGDLQKNASKYVQNKSGEFMRVTCDYLDIKTGDELCCTTDDLRDTDIPLYKIEKMGDGEILYLPCDLFSFYHGARAYILTDIIKEMFSRLFTPVVSLNKKNIDITMQQEDDGILVNLINMNQSRHTLDIVVYDEVPEVRDLEIVIRKKCRSVSMPLGEEFEYEICDDCVKIKMDKLNIHSIIKLVF